MPAEIEFNPEQPHVIYHDDDVVVVNKPADVLSVPGKGPDNQDCLVSRLHGQFPTIRVVHRLDFATSGVMVLALTAESHRELSKQFHDRLTGKTYIADIAGQPIDNAGEVELPLRCDWPNRPKQMVDFEQGKPAKTLWRKIEQFDHFSRVELKPITGRSHQLRVHMQQLGHPILGDRFYAPSAIKLMSKRLHLHALALSFNHPSTDEPIEFESPCPF